MPYIRKNTTIMHRYLKSTVLVFISLKLCTEVYAHGALIDCRSRGTLKTHSLSIPDMNVPNLPHDNCPHCLNGGGVKAVKAATNNIWNPYEPMDTSKPFRHESGLCGDPITEPVPRSHEAGGRFGPPISPIVKTYTQSQVIEFTVDVTTNHNGYFEFFICDATKCGGDISEACFRNDHCAQLQRVSIPECESQNSRECGPIDPAHPGRWYVPCRKGGHVGEHFMGGKYMKYALPVGFTSSHAVMQWYWVAANSCNPPGFIEYFSKFPLPGWGTCEGDGGARGGRNPTLQPCGSSRFPEEFWTCADVAVSASGQSSKKEEDDGDFSEEYNADDREDTRIPTPSPTPSPTNKHKNDSDGNLFGYSSYKNNVNEEERDESDDKNENQWNGQVTSNLNSCVSNWHPCDGFYYKGSNKCCDKNFECVKVNKYYSQCKSSR